MATITINYSIDPNQLLRVGYRLRNSGNPFVYTNPFPGYSQSPYLINSLALGNYEVELTKVCPNCTGSTYGDPVIYPAVGL